MGGARGLKPSESHNWFEPIHPSKRKSTFLALRGCRPALGASRQHLGHGSWPLGLCSQAGCATGCGPKTRSNPCKPLWRCGLHAFRCALIKQTDQQKPLLPEFKQRPARLSPVEPQALCLNSSASTALKGGPTLSKLSLWASQH